MATTRAGYPYPVGTDRVMDGDDVIHAMADKVDTNLGFGLVGGFIVSGVPTGLNVQTTVAVTFPAGRFTGATPAVIATYGGGIQAATCWPIVTSGISATGCNLNFAIASGTLGARTLYDLVFGA